MLHPRRIFSELLLRINNTPMKNTFRKSAPEQLSRKRRTRYLLVGAALLGLAGLIMMLSGPAPPPEQKSPGTALANVREPALNEPEIPPGQAPSVPDQRASVLTRTIADGDNLSAIFDRMKINQTVLFQILAADESLLALDILRPGNRLTFTLDEETGQLQKMELFINPAHQIVYRRLDADTFESEEIVIPGVWKNQTIEAEINGSFYLSALIAGLSEQEAGNITRLFKNKLNFSRDIRAGDRFQVVRSLQLVDGRLTGQSHIEGVRIFVRNRCYTAFLFEDGNYYDEQGESLARAFRRYPFKRRFRVSSPYNLRRLHPITKRIAPHRGVDFSMPSGTPILATADGEVTRVKNHPFAGKYIEIKHDGQYLTRYLHLSRISVRRGQKIKRGELIARSGNTGRSTGPHLHYELHIKGRAVNPLTAPIPTMTTVPKKRFNAFKQRVRQLIALMQRSRLDILGA